MKFSLLAFAALSISVNGFTTPRLSPLKSFGLSDSGTPFFAEEVSTSVEGEEQSIYEKLGFTEEKIAIGVDPEEVLEYLGT